MGPVTTIVITDPELLAKLAAARGRIYFQGPAGEPGPVVDVVATTRTPSGLVIPFSEEELRRRSQDRTGRPIGDVLKDLKEKYGE